MRSIEISIDSEACRAAGECVLRAPESFAIGGDGKAHWTEASAPNSERTLAAARSCPNFAISVRREGRDPT